MNPGGYSIYGDFDLSSEILWIKRAIKRVRTHEGAVRSQNSQRELASAQILDLI